jgi:proteic killer suppression protein
VVQVSTHPAISRHARTIRSALHPWGEECLDEWVSLAYSVITLGVKITMRIEFEDDDLRRLYEDREFHLSGFGHDLTRAFRKKVGLISAATDERDLRALASLHFEKLKGDRSHQHSIRLNQQWRLILELSEDQTGRIVRVVEVVDYH